MLEGAKSYAVSFHLQHHAFCDVVLPSLLGTIDRCLLSCSC